MGKLDDVLDNYIKRKVPELELEEDVDQQEFVNLVKEGLRKQIYDEITIEVRDKALQEADEIIEEKANAYKINEYKKLAIEGFVLAFFVGLFVNQVTEIIGFYKGRLAVESITSTIYVSLVLLGVSILVFIYRFLKNLVDMWKEVKTYERD